MEIGAEQLKTQKISYSLRSDQAGVKNSGSNCLFFSKTDILLEINASFFHFESNTDE